MITNLEELIELLPRLCTDSRFFGEVDGDGDGDVEAEAGAEPSFSLRDDGDDRPGSFSAGLKPAEGRGGRGGDAALSFRGDSCASCCCKEISVDVS